MRLVRRASSCADSLFLPAFWLIRQCADRTRRPYSVSCPRRSQHNVCTAAAAFAHAYPYIASPPPVTQLAAPLQHTIASHSLDRQAERCEPAAQATADTDQGTKKRRRRCQQPPPVRACRESCHTCRVFAETVLFGSQAAWPLFWPGQPVTSALAKDRGSWTLDDVSARHQERATARRRKRGEEIREHSTEKSCFRFLRFSVNLHCSFICDPCHSTAVFDRKQRTVHHETLGLGSLGQAIG